VQKKLNMRSTAGYSAKAPTPGLWLSEMTHYMIL
jgi:hypothetical protein